MNFAIVKPHISILSVLLACFLPLLAEAYISDEALAETNTLEAGTLVISVNETTLNADIASDSNDEVLFSVISSGSIEPQYRVASSKTPSCSDNFYGGLDIETVHDGDSFSGALSSFVSTTTSGGSWEIYFKATSTLNVSLGETCEVSLTVQAWQNEFVQYNTGGFYEEEIVTVVLTASETIGAQAPAAVVLNEIYPNEYVRADAPLEREWIEIYNTTDGPIDIEGWSIGEFSGNSAIETQHIISATNTCSEGDKVGYARPYSEASTVIPAEGLLIVEFCAQNRIHNNGDTVRLFNTSSALVDAHTYPVTIEGKSHARIPDGGTWVDPIPTPGESNTATVDDLLAEGWTADQISEFLPQTGGQAAKATSSLGTRSDENSATSSSVETVDKTGLDTDISTTSDAVISTVPVVTGADIDNGDAEGKEGSTNEVESISLPKGDVEISDNGDTSDMQGDAPAETDPEPESELKDEPKEDIPAENVPSTSTQSEAPLESTSAI